MKSKKKKVVITMGDPAGIGPEVIAQALVQKKLSRLADFIVVGDENVFSRYMPDQTMWPDFVHVEETSLKKLKPGKPTTASGYAALCFLQQAVALIQAGKADALVTAPLSKE